MNFDENSRLYPERGPGKSLPVTTPLEKTLLVIVAILVAIGIGLSISIVSLKRTNKEHLSNLENGLKSEKNVCFSPTCIYEAANLIKSIDHSVDPCTDFYSFVCGNWIKRSHLVSSLESQFTKLSKNIVLRVKDILEELGEVKDLPANKQKTVDFYKSCMDKVHRDRVGAKELLSNLKEFGGWPLIDEQWKPDDFDWADLMIQLFKNGFVDNMLFTVKVDRDVKNTSRSLLSVNQPSLGLNNRIYYVSTYADLISSYKSVIFKLAKLLNSDIREEESMAEINEAFKLESRIANLMKDIDLKIPETFYNIMTLKELETLAPAIPWEKILTNLLPSDSKITNEERIMVTSPSMIKEMNDILKEMDSKTGRRTLANYMLYRVVFNAANYLSKDFYSLINGLLETDNVAPLLLWEICTRVTLELFPLPLTASYVRKYTDNSTKEQLGMMLEDIRRAFADGITNSNWLDDETKNNALLKVKNMKAAIGYRDEIMNDDNLDSYYKDVNITDSYFGNIKLIIAFRFRKSMEGLHEERVKFRWTDVDNLLTANAYYRPGENTIIIPVGVLQDTVFAVGRPNYINYGSLGAIVGHELTHAFDSIGSLYDAEGNYRMWWSKNSWEKFEDRMKCYEEQYDKYYLPAANTNVNGTLTLAENVADNGGLKAAYYAYNTLLSRIGSEKSLPGLYYNEKQMFWISFASVWCRKQTYESIQYTMKHSVHTPSQFRVIGSLSNLEEFSDDFKCKLNSTMNPTTRCFLWK